MIETPIGVERVAAVLRVLIEQGKPVFIKDLTTGTEQPVSAELAASPAGLMPLFLAAGDTVWREATGRRLGIEQVDDPSSLLGMRTVRIEPGPAAPVLLSVMEAISQAERPDMLLANDLVRNWRAATERMRRARRPKLVSPALPAPDPRPTRSGSLSP